MTKTNPMKLLLGAVAGVCAITLVFALSACGGSGTSGTTDAADGAADTKISVGGSPVPHADILENAVSKVLADEGYDLDVVVFQDYVLPNKSLEEGELDANYFQTLGYMQQQNEENGMHLKAVAGVHIEPMGIYSEKHASIDDLAEGATIGVPNDPDNEERALEVLVQKGLLKSLGSYGENGNTSESLNGDAEANPSGFVITPLEAASLPLSLPDLDAAVINGNYTLGADLPATYPALEVEEFDEEGAQRRTNFLVVTEGNESSEKIQALVKAIQSDEVKTYIEDNYKGSVIPSFIAAE
jgi:D-methionine transport system substrate-binding protein